jgi:hypothetical protein
MSLVPRIVRVMFLLDGVNRAALGRVGEIAAHLPRVGYDMHRKRT